MADFPWKAFTDRGDLMPTQLDGLADATLSGVSSVLDNSVNLDTHQIIEVVLDSVTFVADAYVEIYATYAADGTNYEDAPVVGGIDVNTLITQIPIKAGAGARIVTSGLLPILPFKCVYYLVNQANVTLNSSTPTNAFNVYTGRLSA